MKRGFFLGSSRNMQLIIVLGLLLALPLIIFVALEQQRVRQQAQVVPVTSLTDPNVIEVKGQLIAGFPKFPVYPGATIEKSSQQKQTTDIRKGYRAEWKIDKPLSAPKVMNWYLDELRINGWRIIEYPNDPKAEGEQVAQVAKDDLLVYLEVSIHQQSTEIEVFIPENPQ